MIHLSLALIVLTLNKTYYDSSFAGADCVYINYKYSSFVSTVIEKYRHTESFLSIMMIIIIIIHMILHITTFIVLPSSSPCSLHSYPPLQPLAILLLALMISPRNH